jgi:hypothetical protein
MTALPRPLAAAGPARVPLARPRWPGALSAVIAVLMTLASLGGLFAHGLYRDNTWSTAAYRGTDLATLLVAVPVLVVAVVLAYRGSDRARLVWFGVLAYSVYNYAFYLFGTAFNDFFLLYAALESLSLITLVGAIPAVLAVRRAVRPVPARVVAGYMAAVGVMFGAQWVIQAVVYLASGTLPKVIGDSGIHTSIVFALDLTLIVPAFLIGAVLLAAATPPHHIREPGRRPAVVAPPAWLKGKPVTVLESAASRPRCPPQAAERAGRWDGSGAFVLGGTV